MTPTKFVTVVCGVCGQGVEQVLFAAGVDRSCVSPWTLTSHEREHGHQAADFHFHVAIIHHRKEVR
jgi:hypothetical protein